MSPQRVELRSPSLSGLGEKFPLLFTAACVCALPSSNPQLSVFVCSDTLAAWTSVKREMRGEMRQKTGGGGLRGVCEGGGRREGGHIKRSRREVGEVFGGEGGGQMRRATISL